MAHGTLGMRGVVLGATALTMLAACDRSGGMDFDFRDNFTGAFDTSQAVSGTVSNRPEPDSRGVISYPNYQVAVARRGDTVADVAGRVGLPAQEIADYNGIPLDVSLRQGEVIALPRRVDDTSGTAAGQSQSSAQAGALRSESVDVQTLAGDAINRADTPSSQSQTQTASRTQSQPTAPAPTQSGEEPVRHKVAPGETAFSIARRYDVPVSALGEWNGLGSDLTVREGQYLLIPVAQGAPAPEPQDEDVTRPGEGTATPTPPSADEPLPQQDEEPGPAEETPDSPDLGTSATEVSDTSELALPVSGPIIRGFSKGENDGIDIQAAAGTPVRAAEDGTVATITRDTGQVPILVLRHPDGLLTVYAGVNALNVEKGDSVQRGQTIAEVSEGDPSFVHFEVLEGFESVDPGPYLE
ncbi:Murein DD-endopeptidase MepM and murein hydrolase activator NlpD, contain LysM domain [Tranquillimonas rosea]|uniref:Murein DD-endopeptidase MepM and murein hydrolase activator NlpD, contain LysM domain n=1 Tax=Tranquillimonas rosea TaxID=641238 RepID=A0A1H9V3H3_9RHOB|nr:M23 family metallopeptidase [Tranquillimonas rosea]SES16138.1 Murein DD-endopeptidase MepM and murein hydrolase activator NlpD, contain LysM domain [Tranquillimonas rosea]